MNVPGLPNGVEARGFDPDRDFVAMARLVADANAADAFDNFPSPEVLANEWGKTALFDMARDAATVWEGDRLIAIALVNPQIRDGKVSHWIEGWVHPDRRRRGIGRALLAWAEDHARTLVGRRTVAPWDLPQFLTFGVLQGAAELAFAASTGYEPVRSGFIMRRPLDEPIPDLPLPEGLELRPVRPEDHRAIWDADTEAFQDHWESRERDESDFDATFAGPLADTSLWRVAWAGDEVAGVVINEIDPDDNAQIGLDIGWLEHVSVRRPWRNQGLGAALIAASMVALRERGMAIAALGVDGQNLTGALRLYERLGFRPYRGWTTYRRPLD